MVARIIFSYLFSNGRSMMSGSSLKGRDYNKSATSIEVLLTNMALNEDTEWSSGFDVSIIIFDRTN